MKKNILFYFIVIILSACSQNNNKWKTVEIEGLCKFDIPQQLECDNNNEFIKTLDIRNNPYYCKVVLDESKANEKNVLAFVTNKSKHIPYKIAISIDQKPYFSERYAESIMKISDNAIPYLEKNLLSYYINFENISEKEKQFFEWLPIRIVEKDGLRYAVVEYRMMGSKNDLVRVVHSFFVFDGKRIMFSIYCKEKYLQDNEDKYMRFIESVSFKNLKRNDYDVFCDINTNYTFMYPKDFSIDESNEDYMSLGYAHTIRLRTKENTIDVAFYDNFNYKTIDKAKALFKSLFKNITYTNVEINKIKKKGYDTKYFEFDTNGKEYFKGNGLIIEGMSTTILNAILDEEYEESANYAMNMIMSTIDTLNCTYSPYIP